MESYIAIGILLYLCAALDLFDFLPVQHSRLLAIYVVLCTYVMSFLRWEVGTDWHTYLAMFESLRTLEDARSQSWWGPGYSYLAVLTNQLAFSYSFFLWMIASIALAGKLLLMGRVSRPLIFVFLLYCLNFNDLFFVRQHVAAIFISLSILLIFERRYHWALFAGAVGLAFHATAAPLLLLALAIQLRHNRWAIALIFTTLLILAALALTMSIEDLAGGYAVYLSGDFVEDSKENSLARMLLKLAFWLFILAFHFIATKIYPARYSWEGTDKKTAGFLSWVVILSLAGVFFSEIFSRFTLYIYPIMAILFASNAFLGRARGRAPLLGANALQCAFLGVMLVNLWFALAAYLPEYAPFKFVDF